MKMERITAYCAAMIRVFGILASALILPWFFLVYREDKIITGRSVTCDFKLGVENLTSNFIQSICFPEKKSCKVGLITNQSGIDQTGASTIERLLALQVPLKKIFATDTKFRCPAIENKKNQPSLIAFAGNADLHTQLEQHMTDLDIIFFDMQDTGMRYYRTVSLLFEALKIGALYGKTIVVLDRPNLLGSSIEGSLEHSADQTAMSLSVPVRYGMTIGELARYFNLSILKHAARLFVVPMEGYQRAITMPEATPSQCACLQTHIDVNHSTSLLSLLAEVHPIDMATETEHAYQCIMLPDCMHVGKSFWSDLKSLLKEHHIESTSFSYRKKIKNQPCTGLRLKNTQESALSSFNTLISVLRFFKEKGIRMAFSQNFDKALGSTNIRAYLEGRIAWDQLESEINKGLKNFYARAQRAFIYKPYPKIVMM